MIFGRYLFKNLSITTILVACTLAAVILLTQSLRFLELVINAGASSAIFGILTLLALPRFFEIILPIALMAATVFVYNRMTMDSELVVMRSTGVPPMKLARPAIALSGITVVILWIMTTWLAPVSLSNMHQMRQVIKAQYSTFLFREGVFNAVSPGLTVFIRNRTVNGEMQGLIIHDSRPINESPVTVLAKRGIIVATPEGQQVLVYDGSRQAINPNTHVLNRLDFQRYTIDLPEESGPVRQRWPEPDERTLWELLNPDPQNKRDVENHRTFTIEIHRRITSPLLAPAFTLMALACLLLGPVDRRGQRWRIVFAILGTIIIQSVYLAAFNMARHTNWGLFLMYILIFIPLIGSLFLLSSFSETALHKFLFKSGEPT